MPDFKQACEIVAGEKEKILEAINTLKCDPTQATPMKTVHANAMQKARELVATRKK